MQHNPGVLHLREQLFPPAYSAKHAHCRLSVGDKVDESSRWKHLVLINIEDVLSKKLGLQIF